MRAEERLSLHAAILTAGYIAGHIASSNVTYPSQDVVQDYVKLAQQIIAAAAKAVEG